MAIEMRIRQNEGEREQPALLWDSIWNVATGQADWALAGSTEKLNHGGLQATQTLETAVILCLFTDRRVPDDHPLRKFIDGDPGGYWGDGVDLRADLGEIELGSYLHALERSIIDEDTRRWAEQAATESLMPLLTQKACARIDVQAIAEEPRNRLDLIVKLYGRDGKTIFDQRFGDIWRQALS